MIESNGIMSGGGQPKKGGMLTSNNIHQNMMGQRDQQLATLQEELKKLKDKREQLDQYQLSLESKEHELGRDEHQVKRELSQRELQKQNELDIHDEVLIKLEQGQASLRQQATKIEEIRKLEEIIHQTQQNIAQIDGNMKNEKKQIDSINKKIEDQQTNEMKKQKEHLNQIIAEVENEEKQVQKLQHQYKIMPKKYQKLEQELNSLKDEIASNEQQKAQLKQLQMEHEEETLSIIGKLSAAQKQQELNDQNFQKWKAENIEISNLLAEIKKKMTQIKEQIEENENQIRKATDEGKQSYGRLQQIRQQYKETVAEYDFLDELDELYQCMKQQSEVGGVQQSSLQMDKLNISQLNISLLDIEMNESMIDDGTSHRQEKKRASNVAADLTQIMNIDVMEDINDEQLDQYCPIEKEIGRVMAHIQTKVRDAQKDANIQDITTFKKKYQEYKVKKDDLEMVRSEANQKKQELDEKKKKRYELFMNGFNVISQKLREIYQTLTNGGDAELELVDTMDPFSEGVSFSVRPKNKSWKQMSKLSGGEKTLASLSLIFALHYYKPTPLYFFDEVDAALDYKNVSIVANFIKERAKNAQFIVISLRNNMFELANKLVGIYKTFDITKAITIQPELVQLKIKSDVDNNENVNRINIQQ